MLVPLPRFRVKKVENRGQLPVIAKASLALAADLTQFDWLSDPAIKAARRYGRVFTLHCC